MGSCRAADGWQRRISSRHLCVTAPGDTNKSQPRQPTHSLPARQLLGVVKSHLADLGKVLGMSASPLPSPSPLGSQLGHLLSGLRAQLTHAHGAGVLVVPVVHSVLSAIGVGALVLMLIAAAVGVIRGRFGLAALSAVMGAILFAALRSPLATYREVTTVIGKVSHVHNLASAAAAFPAVSEVLVVAGVAIVCLGLVAAIRPLLRSHPIGAFVQAATAMVLGATVSSASSLTAACHLVLSL